MECYTSNFAPTTVRRERWKGRDYVVAPTTLIVSGVLNGSHGPLLYLPSDVCQSTESWNNRPVLVNHPPHGQSAESEGVWQTQGVGVVRNARCAGGKLRGEVWIDTEYCRTIAPDTLRDIELGRPVEVSTGLYTDNEEANGTFRGRAYRAIASNHKPDHLAILTGYAGACSVRDGCGVNNSNEWADNMLAFMKREWPHLFAQPSPMRLTTVNSQSKGTKRMTNDLWTRNGVMRDGSDPSMIPPTLNFVNDKIRSVSEQDEEVRQENARRLKTIASKGYDPGDYLPVRPE